MEPRLHVLRLGGYPHKWLDGDHLLGHLLKYETCSYLHQEENGERASILNMATSSQLALILSHPRLRPDQPCINPKKEPRSPLHNIPKPRQLISSNHQWLMLLISPITIQWLVHCVCCVCICVCVCMWYVQWFALLHWGCWLWGMETGSLLAWPSWQEPSVKPATSHYLLIREWSPWLGFAHRF